MNIASNELDIGEDCDIDLFAIAPVGIQSNGAVTGDIGWACYHLFESMGIESSIGIAGFESADHFKQWSESVIGVALNDWVPVEIVLYECWMPCIHDQFPDMHYQKKFGAREDNQYEDQYCYIAWREYPDADAIKVTRRNIYALRHVVFSLKSEKGLDFIHSARQRSYEDLRFKYERISSDR